MIQPSNEKIDFPTFENFPIDSIDHKQKNSLKVIDLNNNEELNFDEIVQSINDFINAQISIENLIYFPQDNLNMMILSLKANDIYNIIKDQLINFANKIAIEIISLDSSSEIASKWHITGKIISNISHYFNIFTVGKEPYLKILYNTFNKQFSEQTHLIGILHDSIIDSFNNERIQWFSIDCSNLLINCNLFNANLIINELDLNFNTMHQIDTFIQINHSLIPSDKIFLFLDYLVSKVSDFSQFFAEVPQNWKYISSLYEIYNHKENTDDFISKFTSLVKSQFTIFNTFQIFDEIHSLASTNLMFVIKNIATTLFNSQNDTFSILLANYIHITFISLKQPISDKRLSLFDEFGQLSNGLFIRYHCHNLLHRLLNYQTITFDADERFSKIVDHHHITAIINDFKYKQMTIDEFENPSQLLSFSLFNNEFFSDQSFSNPDFPPQFSYIAKSFQDYYSKRFKRVKIRWNFSLMRVTFKVLNISGLKYVKCNGIIALILLKLAEKAATQQKSIKSEDLEKELKISEEEVSNSVEALNTFSLINLDEEKSISLATSLPDTINEQIVIPFIPKFAGVPNQTMVNTAQLEAMITRYVKLHPGQTKEEVFEQLSAFPNFSFTDEEYFNSLRMLIKKQIISPLDSSKVLKLTYS